MITNSSHPEILWWQSNEWVCHLVGSRFLGVFNEKSDYDLIVECDHKEWGTELKPILESRSYKPTTTGYGPDPALMDTHVWRWGPSESYPAVDILVMTPKEACMRLSVFASMKRHLGHSRGGLLARALKDGRAWPYFWEFWKKHHAESI